jgi:hypothetical protein
MLRASLYSSVILLYPCVSFAQCPPPFYTSNQICLDQEGSRQDFGNGVRQRVFALNKRTMDHVYPNVFWIANGEFSVGNVADPKFIYKQYPIPVRRPGDNLPANTTRTFTWSSWYGTQDGGVTAWATYLDANKKIIPVPKHDGWAWPIIGQCWAHPGGTSEEFLLGDDLLDKIEYVIMYGQASEVMRGCK